MFDTLKKVCKDCLTENNGTSYDMIRVVAAGMVSTGFPAFLGMAAYSVYASSDHRFDMVSFGTGFGAILAGVAAVCVGVGFKQRTDTQ